MNYQQIQHANKNIFLVDMRNEENKVFSEITYKGIKKYLKEGKKITILVNKKGYSTGVICEDCGYIPKCNNCDIPVAYHLDENNQYFGICHICKTHYNPFSTCPNCQSANINTYGIGTHRIQKEIEKSFNVKSLLVESETVQTPTKIKKNLQNINDYQIVIGTSLLTTPLKNFDTDIVIFLNADIGLNIPDFKSNSRNFLFLYETFDKYYFTKNFIVQSFNPESYSIKHACNMDIKSFKQEELSYRKMFQYPPYKEVAVLLYKNEIEESLFSRVSKLYQELLFLKEKYKLEDLEIYSTPPLIYKIFGKYRYNIILKGNDVRNFLDIAYSKLKINNRGFKIDRNPENLI